MEPTFPAGTYEVSMLALRNHKHDAADVVEGQFHPDILGDGSVTTRMLKDGAITTNKIARHAVTVQKLHQSVRDLINFCMPIGCIIMWSGSTVPQGWALCNGQNGTLNLQGRFILAQGQGNGLTNRTVGDTGGEEAVTLAEAQMPSHTHTCTVTSAGEHSHTVTVANATHSHSNVTVSNGEHTHPVNRRWTTTTRSSAGSASGSASRRGVNFTTGVRIQENSGAHTHDLTINSSASHSHAVSVANQWNNHAHSVTCANDGGGQSHANMPPFYVLAFIQRISYV